MKTDSPSFNPVQTTPFGIKIKIKAHLWQLVNNTFFRILPLQCRSYRIFLLRLFGAQLANSVTISRLANIEHPWNLTMGDLSSLGDGSWAYCLAPISIDEKCCIGKDVFLLTGSHDVDDSTFPMITRPIIINKGCWVSTGAYILPGVELGQFSVIGARSVVTKSTLEFSIMGGNPAKYLRRREFKK